MNENIDLTKILEGCPLGTKFYSPIYGEVEFEGIYENSGYIKVREEYGTSTFGPDGKSLQREAGECLLFPSRDQRDWSRFERFWDKQKERFDPKTLRPFDRVLARDYDQPWEALYFSHKSKEYKPWCCSGWFYYYCIPYNEETKHLVGTTDDCPEYYKYWEE